MTMVLLTALGVGGATMVGALLGFVFKKISHKMSDIIMAFARRHSHAGRRATDLVIVQRLHRSGHGFTSFSCHLTPPWKMAKPRRP